MKKTRDKNIIDDPFSISASHEVWNEIGKDLLRTSIQSLDEKAKQLLGATTILVGLYFNAIAFSGLHNKVVVKWQLVVYLAPVVLLLISITASLLVFSPKAYLFNTSSSEASRVIYSLVINRRSRLLMIASVFLILGIVSLLLAMSIYLA